MRKDEYEILGAIVFGIVVFIIVLASTAPSYGSERENVSLMGCYERNAVYVMGEVYVAEGGDALSFIYYHVTETKQCVTVVAPASDINMLEVEPVVSGTEGKYHIFKFSVAGQVFYGLAVTVSG